MKIMLLACLFAVFVLVGYGHAQKLWNLKAGSPELDAKVEDIVDRAVTVKNIPLRLNNILIDLDSSHGLFYASQETKRDVTRKLVGLYNSLDDIETNVASKQRIISIIGMADNGPEAHEFFISVLNSDNQVYRDGALGVMYFRYLTGDDLYNTVKNLVVRKTISEYDSLGALKGANPGRAIGDIQSAIKNTEDSERFVKMGNLLSEYGNPALMDVVVARYKYFHDVKKDHNSNLLFCFRRDMLKNYIAAREGDRLKTALDILSSRGVFDDNDVPVLKTKLESKDLSTRGYAADFLGRQLDEGLVSGEKLIQIIKEAHTRETNPDLKFRLEKIIAKHKHAAVSGARK